MGQGLNSPTSDPQYRFWANMGPCGPYMGVDLGTIEHNIHKISLFFIVPILHPRIHIKIFSIR